jgi:hypothetical protein
VKRCGECRDNEREGFRRVTNAKLPRSVRRGESCIRPWQNSVQYLTF